LSQLFIWESLKIGLAPSITSLQRKRVSHFKMELSFLGHCAYS